MESPLVRTPATPARTLPTLRTSGTPAVPTPARTLKLQEEEPERPRPRSHAPSGRASASGKVGSPVTTLSASAGAASLPPRRSRALPLTLGALLLAGGGGVVAFVLKPWAPSSALVEATASFAALATSATAIPARPPVSEAARPAPRMVSVHVASKPSRARLTRECDGVVLGVTPFAGSAAPHAGTERTKKHGHARAAPRPTPQARPTPPEHVTPAKLPAPL